MTNLGSNEFSLQKRPRTFIIKFKAFTSYLCLNNVYIKNKLFHKIYMGSKYVDTKRKLLIMYFYFSQDSWNWERKIHELNQQNNNIN